jgi:hypothetical protein
LYRTVEVSLSLTAVVLGRSFFFVKTTFFLAASRRHKTERFFDLKELYRNGSRRIFVSNESPVHSRR